MKRATSVGAVTAAGATTTVSPLGKTSPQALVPGQQPRPHWLGGIDAGRATLFSPMPLVTEGHICEPVTDWKKLWEIWLSTKRPEFFQSFLYHAGNLQLDERPHSTAANRKPWQDDLYERMIFLLRLADTSFQILAGQEQSEGQGKKDKLANVPVSRTLSVMGIYTTKYGLVRTLWYQAKMALLRPGHILSVCTEDESPLDGIPCANWMNADHFDDGQIAEWLLVIADFLTVHQPYRGDVLHLINIAKGVGGHQEKRYNEMLKTLALQFCQAIYHGFTLPRRRTEVSHESYPKTFAQLEALRPRAVWILSALGRLDILLPSTESQFRERRLHPLSLETHGAILSGLESIICFKSRSTEQPDESLVIHLEDALQTSMPEAHWLARLRTTGFN